MLPTPKWCSVLRFVNADCVSGGQLKKEGEEGFCPPPIVSEDDLMGYP